MESAEDLVEIVQAANAFGKSAGADDAYLGYFGCRAAPVGKMGEMSAGAAPGRQLKSKMVMRP